MSRLAFIVQTDASELTYETQSYVRSHVMVDYMRRKHQQRSPPSANHEDNAENAEYASWKPAGGGSFAVLKIAQKKRKPPTRKQESPVDKENGSSPSKSPRDAARQKHKPARLAAKPLMPRDEPNSQEIVELTEQESKMLRSESIADITGFCGNMKVEAVSSTTLCEIMHRLSYYIQSHGIFRPDFQLGIPAIVFDYFKHHVLTSEAAFFAASLKTLLFTSMEKDAPNSKDPVIPRRDLYFFKAQALHLINEEIRKSPGGIRDSTICATISLEMFENAMGSTAGPIHLKGLHRMIESSKETMYEPELMSRCLMAEDATNAICRNFPVLVSQPLLPNPRKRTAPPPTQHMFWSTCPLRMCDTPRRTDCLPKDLLDLLMNAFMLFDMRYIEATASAANYDGALGFETPRAEIEKDINSFPRAIITPDSDAETRIAEACRLTAVIFYRATVELIPFHDPVNKDDYDSLYAVMRDVGLSDWCRIPYVYLWVIMTGAAGSVGIPGDVISLGSRKSFYYRRSCQFWIMIGLRWWDDFWQIMSNFYWLQKLLRESTSTPGRLLDHATLCQL